MNKERLEEIRARLEADYWWRTGNHDHPHIDELFAALEAAQERIAKLDAVAEAARNVHKWKDADYAGSSGVIISAIQFVRLKDALAALEEKK